MQNTKSPRAGRRWRRWLWRTSAIVGLALLVWLGVIAWNVWLLRKELLAVQQFTQQRPISTQSATAVCQHIQSSSSSMRRVRSLSVPLHPVLRRLGWLPRVGTLVAAAPALSDAGLHGLDLLTTSCQEFAPAFVALDRPAPERLQTVFSQLHTPPHWRLLRQQGAAFHAAWLRIPPAVFDVAPLQAFREPAKQLTPLFADVDPALALLEQLWSVLPRMLGMEQPRNLLVVAQNPFELRATGGFIGSVGRVTLAAGKMRDLTYANSADYAQIAPQGSTMPAPYTRYLRGSLWTLRDANWWADWPTSAKAIATFWELNQQPPIDGVVGVDLYALQSVLAYFPTLEVPNYGVITDTNSLEAIYRGYEPQAGAIGGNKAFLGNLFQATIQRIQSAPPQTLLGIAAALKRSLDERHISVLWFDAATQQPFAQNHWDGSVRQSSGDYLQVVDSDLSYSDVQAFIEQRIHLDVAFDEQRTPLTHTVTLTYTNRYDDWQADQTAHQIFGYCYNVAQQQQQRIPGCYGDYVRLYVPNGSIPLDLVGADSQLEPTLEQKQTVLGGYFVLMPGETRVITFSYRPLLPAQSTYQLLVQKQAGTLARPLTIRLHTSAENLTLTSDLWHDQQITAAFTDGLQLNNPVASLHPSNSPEREAQFAQWWQGWQQWQHGDHERALATWQQTTTLDRALDQVNALYWRNQSEQAQQLLDVLAPLMDNSGRWAFIAAHLAQQRNDQSTATTLYQQAIDREPATQVARFALARLLLERDQAAGTAMLQTMHDPIRWLRQAAWEERFAGDVAASDRTNRQIIVLHPTDRVAWEERYWLARFGTNPVLWSEIVTLASDATTQFPTDATWLHRRAESYQALNQPEQALADWQQATVISPTNALAWYNVGLMLRNRGERESASLAFEKATQNDSTRLEYVLALGETYEALNKLDQARQAYQQAAKLSPSDQSIQDVLNRLTK